MSRRFDPGKRFIIQWTHSAHNQKFTNRYRTFEEAEKRFYYLLDRGCHPVWVQRGDEKKEKED